MGEVAGAVIATSLVLVAVFVPVALFPGTTGRIYQQFSLTIAFSIALSALNALTLTPALSALLLRHDPNRKNVFFRAINGALAWFTHLYRRALAFTIRHRIFMAVLFAGGLVGTYFTYKMVPTGFVPNEDQGYLIVNVQLPPGASLQKTVEVAKQIEEILSVQPEIEGAFSVNGFNPYGGNAANKGLFFINLMPIGERKGADHSAAAVVERLRGPLMGIQGGYVIPFLPPSIQGVGSFGGFQFEVEDRAGGPIENLAGATFALMGAAAQDPDLRGVFSSFTANDPQIVVDIDREQAKSLSIPLNQITDTLQIYMGSAYVNDFDFNNRAYRVYAQADRDFRAGTKDIRQFYVRSDRGQMVPLDAVTHISETTAPQIINHFNLFRSTEVNGSAAPGVSSGDALKRMQALAERVLPQGMSFEWAGISYEEVTSGTQTIYIFLLGVLIVYLVLAAQYESFALPVIILLAVPLAIMGALLFQWLRGYANDVFCQVGLVMLVGLASKNAILIVEFAEQLRHSGMSIADAAIEAARIRLRPILMTSLAFILGVLPLVVASGAGQMARRSLGTAVFGGMVFSTALNLLFIPILYVTVETFRERGGKKLVKAPGSTSTPPAPPPAGH
jgi:hydrophobic/amphiphilic exporter-1 (mainly G- bacteria), HAE1 family